MFLPHRANAQFVQQGPKLVGTGAIGGASQGDSVLLSNDGNTAIVGGQLEAWVWTRSGGIWSQQIKLADSGVSVSLSGDGNTAIVGSGGEGGVVWTRLGEVWTRGPTLVGSGAVGDANQGISVSLSTDGNTAIIGGDRDSNFAGAAWVWTRNGELWSEQSTKLVGLGSVGSAQQGFCVSLSADGNTAIVGGPNDNSQTGAAWVWNRNGGVWTQQSTKLVASGGAGRGYQGYSVSLSTDGNTAVVGGPATNNGAGAAFVWTRSGAAWTQQGGSLFGSGAVGNANQGNSVSISANGDTVIVGGSGDGSGAGAAWIWTRASGVWTQQGDRLIGSGAVGNAFQGNSVSLSRDSNTAIVGGPGDTSGDGATWVWTRSNGIWTQQGSKLIGSGAEGRAGQGNSVSISADGNTAIVGGPSDNNRVGAAWVWTRSGGAWAQQGPKLVGTGSLQQGWSVSLSADGNTAIVGGGGCCVGGGPGPSVWTKSGGVWTQQGTELVGPDAVGNATQGISVALSGDGNTAIVGGYSDGGGSGDNNLYFGAAWIWTRSGGVWTQQGPKLVGTGADGPAGQGLSVAISADGNTAIIGGPFDAKYLGAAWIWTRNEGVWIQQGPKLVSSGGVDLPNQNWGSSVSLSADGNTAIVGPYQQIVGVQVWTRNREVWTQQGPRMIGSDQDGYIARIIHQGSRRSIDSGAWGPRYGSWINVALSGV
ncbi:MAG: hypothetical protein ACYC9N_17560, partial [Thermoanaerobaculia bacterium]